MRTKLMSAMLAAVITCAPLAQGQEAPVAAEPLAPMTFQDACCGLGDLCPGEHKISVIHPFTCCPVDVCFCLPCGCYRLECKDGCLAKRLVFKYKGLCNDVVIKFKKNGDVVVND